MQSQIQDQDSIFDSRVNFKISFESRVETNSTSDSKFKDKNKLKIWDTTWCSQSRNSNSRVKLQSQSKSVMKRCLPGSWATSPPWPVLPWLLKSTGSDRLYAFETIGVLIAINRCKTICKMKNEHLADPGLHRYYFRILYFDFNAHAPRRSQVWGAVDVNNKIQ